MIKKHDERKKKFNRTMTISENKKGNDHRKEGFFKNKRFKGTKARQTNVLLYIYFCGCKTLWLSTKVNVFTPFL